MAKICPSCGGTQVGCPTCGLPPRRVLPKLTIYEKVYSAVFGAETWEVQGIDVSAWNGVMNFAITKTKCQYVIVRLGYGNGWKDSRCDQYRRDLIANDIPYGVYWYNKIGEDINIHAESFAEVAAEFPFQMGYEEDFEQTKYTNKTETLNWITSYDAKLKSLVNKKTSPYSNANFWNNNVAPNNYFTEEQWVANWTTRDAPYMPNGWIWKQGCKWQYSANGNLKAKEYGMVSGGDPDIDLNRYYGTCAQFNARYGTHIVPIGTPPPPTPPPGQLPEYVIITTGELAIHSTPQAITSNIIGHALLNTKWYPYEQINANGIDWYRVGKNAYISKNYTKLP